MAERVRSERMAERVSHSEQSDGGCRRPGNAPSLSPAPSPALRVDIPLGSCSTSADLQARSPDPDPASPDMSTLPGGMPLYGSMIDAPHYEASPWSSRFASDTLTTTSRGLPFPCGTPPQNRTAPGHPGRSAGRTVDADKLSSSYRELSLSPSARAAGQDSPSTPTGPSVGPGAPHGGSRPRRTASQSSVTRRLRKLSGALTSGDAVSSPSAGRDPAREPASSLRLSTSGHPVAFPTEASHAGQQTPTQANTNATANASSVTGASGLLTSSLSFLSNLASIDRLPSVSLPTLGFGSGGGGEKDAFPRGAQVSARAEDALREEDLRIEQALAGEGVGAAEPASVQEGTTHDSPLNSPLFRSVRELPASDSDSSDGEEQASDNPRPRTGEALLQSPGETQPPSQALASSVSAPAAHCDRTSTAKHHRRNSTLDPLTFQAISRDSSEADAIRAADQRAQRDRQLDLQDRLQEQTQTSRQRVPEPTNVVLTPFTGSSFGRGAPAQSEKGIGLGHPSSPLHPGGGGGAGHGLTSETSTPDISKTRRRSIFSRLGFSPSSKKTSSVESASPHRIPPVPPLPVTAQVHLPTSASVSSLGSFNAVAIATQTGSQRPDSLASVSSFARKDSEAAASADITPTESRASTTSAVGLAGHAHHSGSAAHTERNRYIKTKLKNKSKREFSSLFLAQELVIQPVATNVSSPPLPPTPTTSTRAPVGSAFNNAPVVPQVSSSPSKGPATPSANAPRQPKRTAPSPKGNAIWALKFSPDGNYMASAGQDGVVRVWEVISSSEQRAAAASVAADPRTSCTACDDPATSKHQSRSKMSKREQRASRVSFSSTSPSGAYAASEKGKAADAQQARQTFMAPVFAHKPLHEWTGHTSDVLDLSWSKNNFLLSSSMDKTVRLWHVSRKECLCAFAHLDFVTAIAFHPKDDRYFLSGSLDARLRLWSIPDKRVHCWTQLPELITCVSFTSDGALAIAGTFVGLCLFFHTADLRFVSRLHSKRARGKNAKGRKITNIAPMPRADPSEPERILVTSNDSRVRLWNIGHIVAPRELAGTAMTTTATAAVPKTISEKYLQAKYKGHENASSQIKAWFSPDGRQVISGSEDRQVYLWQSGIDDFPAPFVQTSKKGADKSPACESFTPVTSSSADGPALCRCSAGAAGAAASDKSGHGGPGIGIVTSAVFAPFETRITLARSGDPLLGEDGEGRAGSPGDTGSSAGGNGIYSLRRLGSYESSTSSLATPRSVFGRSGDEEGSVASGSAASAPSATEGSIIVIADDQSGVIRIYRNHAFSSTEARRDRKDSSASRSESVGHAAESGGRERKTSFFSSSKRSRNVSKGANGASAARPSHDLEELA